jgi:hypothetical protein
VTGWIAVVVVTALQTVTGLGVVAALGAARSLRELVRLAGVAPLAGMASAGVVGATLTTLGSRLGLGGLVALAVLAVAPGAGRLALAGSPKPAPPRRPHTRIALVATVTSLAAIAVVAAFALAGFRDKPLAEYDGWAIWGMKARALATLGSADPAVFAAEAYERLHLEYPLLLPTLQALPLQAADGFASNTLLLSCLAIGFAGLLAIWAILREVVQPPLLLAFVAAIACAPAFVLQLQTGYADVPLAVFVAAGLAAAGRWLVRNEWPWLALATLFFAAAALTKNEGILFAASALVPLLVAAHGRRWVVALSAAIVALAYAPWRLYMLVHDLDAPDYDLSSSFDVPFVAGRLDRAPVAAEELLREALEPRQLGLLLLLGLAATLAGLAAGRRDLGVLAGGFALLSFAGLTWIYVLTPYEVTFFLSTNSNRVVVAPVIALAAVTPLLVAESARALERRAERAGPVGAPR